ncbi:hypothetical protein K431DRAFT_219806 [Polychaeton citri CBS 116435]|uniref:Prokaryotic-type class I peptide chain release factors domain-containing protein n=1 Tax=Polychaeton citri CBS 116435 TaxID=1314669 RepID=A0A9P4QA67_9PEZI|nr:hypothetical protein K431DRAFT_219806 [Polychaeton citri CBS 116435]
MQAACYPSLHQCYLRTSSERLAGLVRRYGIKRGADYDADELDVARQWLAKLDAETIPRSICDVSFSRSSGPGGQNVNKVSSKATLRISTSELLPLIPKIFHKPIVNSRYYASKTRHLVIQSDDSRKQNENVLGCYRKLNQLIEEAGRKTVPGETSPEQLKRVEELQKAEAIGRRRIKEFQSQKKTARRGRRDDY